MCFFFISLTVSFDIHGLSIDVTVNDMFGMCLLTNLMNVFAQVFKNDIINGINLNIT